MIKDSEHVLAYSYKQSNLINDIFYVQSKTSGFGIDMQWMWNIIAFTGKLEIPQTQQFKGEVSNLYQHTVLRGSTLYLAINRKPRRVHYRRCYLCFYWRLTQTPSSGCKEGTHCSDIFYPSISPFQCLSLSALGNTISYESPRSTEQILAFNCLTVSEKRRLNKPYQNNSDPLTGNWWEVREDSEGDGRNVRMWIWVS